MSLDVDQDILELYRWFLQRQGIRSNKPRFGAHVSVIRAEHVSNVVLWKTLHAQTVKFNFSPEIFQDETYLWLPIEASELSEIRESLGLTPVKFGVTMSPNGQHKFHLTIGNTK
jgi:hypothetical protein